MTSILVALALLSPASAGGLAGVDLRPYARGDADWVAQGAGSGTRAAENDGYLQPALTAWAGPTVGRHAFLFGFAMAWQRTLSWTGAEADQATTLRRRMVGSVRPSFDYRFYLREPAAGVVLPWAAVGAHGVVPFVRYEDEQFSLAEQAEWDEIALEDRARIAGFGGRATLGAEVRLENGLSLGARHAFSLHRAQEVDEDTYTATVLLDSDTALVLGFAF